MGYFRAGFDVVGVDVQEQPRYPFPFVRADALRLPFRLEDFDALHASPPCQKWTQMSARWRGKGTRADEHLDLLSPTRDWFAGVSIPWVIENVPGARRAMQPTLVLHGGMFGLGVHRPRLFETNFLILKTAGPQTKQPLGVYGKPDGPTTYRYRNNGNYKGKSLIRAWKSLEEGSAAMGIDWMDIAGLREAIPPAYTEFIGRQLIQAISERVA